MATGMVSSAEVLGSRLLREVKEEEGSLEDLLTQLRHLHPSTHPQLQTSHSNTEPTLSTITNLLQHHGTKTLTLSGTYTPLINSLLISLLSPHRPSTICILDLTHRFSPSHLLPHLPIEELKHIHILHPTPRNLQVTLDSLENYMLYSLEAQHSRNREWRGIFVLGGSPTSNGTQNQGQGITEEKLLVGTSWRGWLRVEREETSALEVGISVEEAWEERERRWEEVERKGWKGVCEEGVVRFE